MTGILCRYGREKIIRNQLQEDELNDQIGLCKYFDVFTGWDGKERQGKGRFSGGL